MGRPQAKRMRQKARGLDRRLTGMMMRVNTSFTADLTASKRPRLSSESPSSNLSSEVHPRTPLDAIHERSRGTRLGDNFSVIKLEDSSERGLEGFLTDDLPSWTDKKKDKVRVPCSTVFSLSFVSANQMPSRFRRKREKYPLGCQKHSYRWNLAIL